MNSPFVVEQAQRCMKRPEIAGAADLHERIERLYKLLFARPAGAEEITFGQQYVESKQPPGEAPNKLSPWEHYVQALLMTNEFVYID